jgi:hypothetical protein
MANRGPDKIKSILKVAGYWILFIVLLIPVTSQSGVVFSTQVRDWGIRRDLSYTIYEKAIKELVTGSKDE